MIFEWNEIPNCHSINYDGFIVRENDTENWKLEAINKHNSDDREHVIVSFPMETILEIMRFDGTHQIDFRLNEAASSKAKRIIEFFKMQYAENINGWILPSKVN